MLRTRSLLPLLLLLAAAAAYAAQIVGGPLVVHAGPKSATIVWVVQDFQVELGDSPDSVDRTSAPGLRAVRVSFTGLKPGKRYYYKVPGRDGLGGSFRTAPRGDADFQFVVFGDTRTRHKMHRDIVEAIVRDTEPDFVIHTGDLVSNGRESAQWPRFFEIEAPLLRKAAFFPVLGNHERNSPHFHDFFAIESPYYSFDWGRAHFVILNSDYGNVAASKETKERFWDDQLRWLERDLAEHQDAALRFVAMHHPPFTAVKRRQRGKKRVGDMVPLFEKYNVTAVYLGHDHNYQHHVIGGVHYIVTGGGGAPLYPVDAPLDGVTLKVESVEHYVRVAVQGDRAVSEAVTLDGRIIERVEFPGRDTTD